MDDWEIVEGDFGSSYKAIAEEKDLSTCTATIKVWRNSTLLIDSKACGVITYDSEKDESYCYYDVEDGDIPIGSVVDDDVTPYKVMVEFTKSGYKEHDLGLKWMVHPAPPPSPP